MTSHHSPRSQSGYAVGAYATSAAHSEWNPQFESDFFERLAENSDVNALEIPWMGSIHPHDDEWMHANFPSTLQAIVTDIPFVMGRIGQSGEFGLASGTNEGRLAAIAAARAMRDSVAMLNDAQGRQVVSVVELHGAPRPPFVTPVALAASLSEIASWDWNGAQLVIEHQDAYREDTQPQKGFLTLADEIDAINVSGAPVGISLNWGRSVIEGRRTNTAAEHAALAAEAGVLRGIIVSGATDIDTETSDAWVDAHHAFRTSPQHPFGDAGSLLTEAALRPTFAAAGELDWVGVKVSWPASRPGTAQQRAQMVADAIAGVKRARV